MSDSNYRAVYCLKCTVGRIMWVKKGTLPDLTTDNEGGDKLHREKCKKCGTVHYYN